MLGKDFAGEATVLWMELVSDIKGMPFFTFRMLALNVFESRMLLLFVAMVAFQVVVILS